MEPRCLDDPFRKDRTPGQNPAPDWFTLGRLAGRFFHFDLLTTHRILYGLDSIGTRLAQCYLLDHACRLANDRLLRRLGDFIGLVRPIDICDVRRFADSLANYFSVLFVQAYLLFHRTLGYEPANAGCAGLEESLANV